MPTLKEPPMDYAAQTTARQQDIPSPAFARNRRATVVIGCAQCKQRHR